MWMLDTNICSYILRERPASVKARFLRQPPGRIAVSSVVAAELYYGAARHPKGAAIRGSIEQLLNGLTILAWDRAAADAYGTLRAQLERKGQLIGALDLQIAAHALVTGAILVTNNQREFSRVPGLKLENWIAAAE